MMGNNLTTNRPSADRLNQLRERAAELRQQLSETKASMDAHQADLGQQSTVIDRLVGQHESLQLRIARLENPKTEGSRRERIEANIGYALANLGRMLAGVQDAQMTVTELERSQAAERLRKKYDGLTGEIGKRNALVKSTLAAIETLSTRRAVDRESLRALNAQIRHAWLDMVGETVDVTVELAVETGASMLSAATDLMRAKANQAGRGMIGALKGLTDKIAERASQASQYLEQKQRALEDPTNRIADGAMGTVSSADVLATVQEAASVSPLPLLVPTALRPKPARVDLNAVAGTAGPEGAGDGAEDVVDKSQGVDARTLIDVPVPATTAEIMAIIQRVPYERDRKRRDLERQLEGSAIRGLSPRTPFEKAKKLVAQHYEIPSDSSELFKRVSIEVAKRSAAGVSPEMSANDWKAHAERQGFSPGATPTEIVRHLGQ